MLLRRAFFAFAALVVVPSTVEAFDHHHHHHGSSHSSGCSSSHASSSSSTPASSRGRSFVTSTTYAGAVGGIAAADAFCQARAYAGHLDGSYRAWISTTQVSASDRLGPAPDITSLRDENGAVPVSPDAWTGSDGETCDDWTNATSEVSGDVLDRSGATSPLGCDRRAALICVLR